MERLVLVSSDIAHRSRQLVETCRLDTMSIFFSQRGGLTYLYHHGVSEAAQHAYKDGRVFEDDPFTKAAAGGDGLGQLIHWNDRRITREAATSRDYRQFINCHSVDVVGAWVQRVMPDFYLVIGAHCRPGGNRAGDVSYELLAHEAAAISQAVIAQLLEEALIGAGGGAGRGSLLRAVLAEECGDADDGNPGSLLSSRELQIAQLVSSGNQNKQVAWISGISEFTVENHLRRIYRKLNVRNRAAMTAKLFGAATYQ